ncbi:MAG: zinc-binding protein [Firmicutes bacterium]|nr:zinc-binding protein [Bacillota bacterium]
MEGTREECLCAGGNVLVFACSGGSNVGQISNQAAIALEEAGLGRFFCLAGIGGNLPDMVEPAREAEKRILIDGCPVSCGKATFARAGLKADCYVVVTQLGIKKRHEFAFADEEVEKVVAEVKEILSKTE